MSSKDIILTFCWREYQFAKFDFIEGLSVAISFLPEGLYFANIVENVITFIILKYVFY